MAVDQSLSTPRTIHLQDYLPPAFLVESIELVFELDPTATLVTSRLELRRNPCSVPGGAAQDAPLELNGESLELLGVTLDGVALDERGGEGGYTLAEGILRIAAAPASCVLEVRTRIDPQGNTALEGLYLSNGMFCTQCEAEGFRRITYFPDRPDVMARFTTMVIAERAHYPVLLSNGNLVETGELDGGRHFARWQDPFKKPAYLFALVAGDLQCREEVFTTASGRDVALRVYVEAHNLDKTAHAMASLKKAMRWDEEMYGREYDLDLYMIVSVDHFNMGAMENKGLNLFNSKYVLAKPETATDADYQGVEGVIAHEYFHNWTGNRITCRDWFQLSLKEGLTVFRDQQFSADQWSAAVRRIGDVRALRASQFPEDAGPLAHPVRPEAYIEIGNFYTATVYEKGAEIIRMQHTLLGPEGFRRGMDLYFERHDGEAVTIEDFVRCMEDASGLDLRQFRHWYAQAGTPEVTATWRYLKSYRALELTLAQHTPPTPGQPHKEPLHIPVAVGLIGAGGTELPVQLEGETEARPGTRVLSLTAASQTFHFLNVAEPALPSLFRGFSAPIKLHADYSDADLRFLTAHDTDAFNRWEAAQTLASRLILRHAAGAGSVFSADDLGGFGALIADRAADPALLAEALTPPSLAYLGELVEVIDMPALFRAREALARAVAVAFADALRGRDAELQDAGPYRLDGPAVGRRALKNACLHYLAQLPGGAELAAERYHGADNMTDAAAALGALNDLDHPARDEALAHFYHRWQNEPLVVDKWFGLQARSAHPDTLGRVQELLRHPAFDLKNPNRVRALVGAFVHGNPLHFHAAGGAGYAFLADQVLRLDPLNPQIASRLLAAMNRWRKHVEPQCGLMRAQLERVRGTNGLSKDSFEIASKALAG